MRLEYQISLTFSEWRKPLIVLLFELYRVCHRKFRVFSASSSFHLSGDFSLTTTSLPHTRYLTMLWKLVVALLAFLRPSLKENQEPAWGIVSDVGPQTLEELERAHNALHGPHEGGDILVNADRPAGDGIRSINYRWLGYPGKGIVPYQIDASLNPIKDKITQAMNQYHKLTCIEFVPKNQTYRDWIYLTKGSGCNSYVGRQGGRQIVNLGDGCEFVGTIVHELGHAIGFHHEHQRSDRDNYITVYRNNVIAAYRFAVDKTNVTDEILLTQYDYSSIMHYGNYAFSISPGRVPTMVAKNGQRLLEPYEKPGFTNYDVSAVKQLYKCK